MLTLFLSALFGLLVVGSGMRMRLTRDATPLLMILELRGWREKLKMASVFVGRSGKYWVNMRQGFSKVAAQRRYLRVEACRNVRLVVWGRNPGGGSGEDGGV